MKPIFNDEQLKRASLILESPLAKLSELYSNEIKDLAVVWCYYSGRIEGNTYTYVETEALLKDGITSEKKYEDAKMLKNLYNTFISELEYINKGKNQETINERTLFRIHQSISTGLVSNEESGSLRTRAVLESGRTGQQPALCPPPFPPWTMVAALISPSAARAQAWPMCIMPSCPARTRSRKVLSNARKHNGNSRTLARLLETTLI